MIQVEQFVHHTACYIGANFFGRSAMAKRYILLCIIYWTLEIVPLFNVYYSAITKRLVAWWEKSLTTTMKLSLLLSLFSGLIIFLKEMCLVLNTYVAIDLISATHWMRCWLFRWPGYPFRNRNWLSLTVPFLDLSKLSVVCCQVSWSKDWFCCGSYQEFMIIWTKMKRGY